MYLEQVDASLGDHGQPEEVEGGADADGELVPVGQQRLGPVVHHARDQRLNAAELGVDPENLLGPNRANRSRIYRVGHLVVQLGWVDLDLGCSTILLGQ